MPDDLARLEILQCYARKLQRLRVDRAHGVALHKPILLLSVMERFERGQMLENRIDLSPKLNWTFLKYWSDLGSASHYPDISRPYFHMKSGKFWPLVMNPGFEPTIAARVKLRTLPALRSAVKYAYLDAELFHLLSEPKTRAELTTVLIQVWFPERGGEIVETFQVDEFGAIQRSLFDSGGRFTVWMS